MRTGLLLIIFCLVCSLAFPQSQESLTKLYSHYLKGLFLLEKEQYAEGLKELSKAKAQDPQSIHIRLKMATAYIRMEKVKEAEKILLEAKRIAPDNLDISLALIFVYSYTRDDAGLEREYEEFLKKAHQTKPKDIGVSEYLAQFYFYKKKPLEAITIYKKIIESSPEYVSAYFWLGYLYEDAGKVDEAISVWEKGLAFDDAYAPILNSLGYTYAVKGIKLKKAEAMIRKALDKEPENGAYLDSLGWVYYQKGDLKRAEKYLIKAITLVKDPEIYAHLGDLYIRIGDRRKGVAYLEEGLSHFPDDKVLQSMVSEYGKKDKATKGSGQ